MGNVMQNRKEFTVIGLCTISDWELIRDICKREDVSVGGEYDAPYGGAINVWSRTAWDHSAGDFHGTFYPEISDSREGWINVFWQTGAKPNQNGLRPRETDWEDVEYSEEGNWTAYRARQKFYELYKRARGIDYLTQEREEESDRLF